MLARGISTVGSDGFSGAMLGIVTRGDGKVGDEWVTAGDDCVLRDGSPRGIGGGEIAACEVVVRGIGGGETAGDDVVVRGDAAEPPTGGIGGGEIAACDVVVREIEIAACDVVARGIGDGETAACDVVVRGSGGIAGDVARGRGGGSAGDTPVVRTFAIGGIVSPCSGAVVIRTGGGSCGCCEVECGARRAGSGATSPAPRIGGTVAVMRGCAIADPNSSSDGSDAGGVPLCNRSISSFTAVDSVFAMAHLPGKTREELRRRFDLTRDFK